MEGIYARSGVYWIGGTVLNSTTSVFVNLMWSVTFFDRPRVSCGVFRNLKIALFKCQTRSRFCCLSHAHAAPTPDSKKGSV